MRDAIRLLMGACAVYGIVAACSDDPMTGGTQRKADGGPEAGADGALAGGGSGGAGVQKDASADGAAGVLGAIKDAAADVVDAARDAVGIDRVTTPVEDAMAQDARACSCPQPIVQTVACDTIHDGRAWAVLTLPGRTPESLTGVRALGKLVSGTDTTPPFSVAHTVISSQYLYVGNGDVATWCQNPALTSVYTEVTFYVP